ncbi:hypothetical protein [Leptotrichia sp. oral taxon 218]|uniref:hypothetical protein n=1 Tax=Leptotrichia sp. oral taxon 218 TaxID=712361 RepID=UPI0020113693|nr:hypothetical protein [Leptotrichia sp. oral taxon 218]
MEKFLNITNHYKVMTGSGDLSERQKGYEELVKIYALFDTYKNSSAFSDFQQKYPLDESLNNIEKIITQRLKNNNYNYEYYGYDYFKDVTNDINNYYEDILKFIESMEKNPKISNEMALKYEQISKQINKNKANKFIEFANTSENKKNYREAQRFYEEADKLFVITRQDAKKVSIKTKELKEKADLQAAENAYSIALSILKNAKTRNDYRNAVWGLERANELVPNYKDSVSLISKYKDKIYVKYNIFGCSNSWVEKYLDKKLENVIGKKTSANSAEVQINCRVTDNYNISTFPSNIENLIEIREIVNNAGEKVTKEFIFQKIKSLAIEKISFNYEIEVSGLVKQRYSNNLSEKNEVHSLQYTGDIPKEYKDKDKIEKPLGETKMRNKILEKSNLEKELNQIIDAMDRL